MSLTLVLTTVGNHEDAIRISRALVEERLCACAQIQLIESVYRWNGAVV
ncbi:MAG: divalent-cation tolerance protein CutA, partial [Betaproteobacteria bacterium]|nr:divalent-cation tolerance protein CutA [Betaproteobacteria bacterium]